MSNVIPFPANRIVAEGYLSKKQLAAHFGFSTRWIELRTREGMPSQVIGGRRRYKLSSCENWLRNR